MAPIVAMLRGKRNTPELMRPNRRALLLGGTAVAVGGAIAAATILASRQGSAVDVGEILMLGFGGHTVESPSALAAAGHIAGGRAAGVVFVKENVGTRKEVTALLRLFARDAPAPPLLAIDHEGGAVQRLVERHGFTIIPSALKVAERYKPEEARELYAKAAREFADVGFNVNLAPVLDLHDPANPAIGKWGRSYSEDPDTVVAYAEVFIDAFAEAGVICAPKHFPGQGLATADSHDALPDISAVWSERDLAPFKRLIESGRVDLMMGGHVLLRSLDPSGVPTTLSPAVNRGLLRDRLGYRGAIMTDELAMGALDDISERRDIAVRALAAGNDLLMMRNVVPFDHDLPLKVQQWVEAAVADGTLSVSEIAASATRVRNLRGRAIEPGGRKSGRARA